MFAPIADLFDNTTRLDTYRKVLRELGRSGTTAEVYFAGLDTYVPTTKAKMVEIMRDGAQQHGIDSPVMGAWAGTEQVVIIYDDSPNLISFR